MVLRWYFDGSSKDFRGVSLFSSILRCPPALPFSVSAFCIPPCTLIETAAPAGRIASQAAVSVYNCSEFRQATIRQQAYVSCPSAKPMHLRSPARNIRGGVGFGSRAGSVRQVAHSALPFQLAPA